MKDAEKDTADRKSADELSIKFLKDFKKFIDESIIAKMKSDGAQFKFPTTDFDAKVTMYYHDFVKAS